MEESRQAGGGGRGLLPRWRPTGQARKLADHEKQIATAKQTVTRLLSESMDRKPPTQIQNKIVNENENRNIANMNAVPPTENLNAAGPRSVELKQVRAMSQAAEHRRPGTK